MLSSFQVHFEPSDILVVGRWKEVKKGAIPSRFCRYPFENFCKSQIRKRKKKKIHMHNVEKNKSNSHIC